MNGIMKSRKLCTQKRLRSIWRNWQLYVLILPTLLYLWLFQYEPMYGIVLAFKKYKPLLGIANSPWVGWDNFEKFFSSYMFGEVMFNTVALSLLTLLIAFPFPVITALLLNQLRNIRYKKSIQTISYAPHFISTVVIVGMIGIFLSPYGGLLNTILDWFGIDSVNYLAQKNAFRSIYIISEIWQNTGFAMIIYLAALTSVDPALHEAASIDGAGTVQRIIYIDFPTLVPTIVICFVLSLGSLMNLGFEKVYLLQNDANLEVSEVIATYVYKRGLVAGDMGFSTAVGLFNNVINTVLLVGANYLSRKLTQMSLW
jgi:putative aldouronate transport system permease protein